MADDRQNIIEQHGERRRRARDGIVDAITESDDPKFKTVLRLLLSVVEEIGDKIDTVLANEKGLRDVVLNGHAEVHHEHHEWVAQRIGSKCAETCEWSRKKMEAEAQAEKDAKEIAKAGKKAAVEQFARTAVMWLFGVASGLTAALTMLR